MSARDPDGEKFIEEQMQADAVLQLLMVNSRDVRRCEAISMVAVVLALAALLFALEARFDKRNDRDPESRPSANPVLPAHADIVPALQFVFRHNPAESLLVSGDEAKQLSVGAFLPRFDMGFGLGSHLSDATQIAALGATQEESR